MGRKTISVTEAVFDRLETLKHDDESWSEFWSRAADTLESPDGDGEHGPQTAVVENVDELARATADEVENRMTRR